MPKLRFQRMRPDEWEANSPVPEWEARVGHRTVRVAGWTEPEARASLERVTGHPLPPNLRVRRLPGP